MKIRRINTRKNTSRALRSFTGETNRPNQRNARSTLLEEKKIVFSRKTGSEKMGHRAAGSTRLDEVDTGDGEAARDNVDALFFFLFEHGSAIFYRYYCTRREGSTVDRYIPWLDGEFAGRYRHCTTAGAYTRRIGDREADRFIRISVLENDTILITTLPTVYNHF